MNYTHCFSGTTVFIVFVTKADSLIPFLFSFSLPHTSTNFNKIQPVTKFGSVNVKKNIKKNNLKPINYFDEMTKFER